MKYALALAAVILSGCAIQQNDQGQFGTVPVEATDAVTYNCIASKEVFVKYLPQMGKTELLPYSVTVTDNGTSWKAVYPGGVTQTPPLYKDLLGKIDGALDLANGVRYYRIHGKPAPTYSYSAVDPNTGNGTGMTFFSCQLPIETK